MQAIWNGAVIAESDDIVTVEGNAYFPADSLRPGTTRDSAHRTTCPWKGIAHYHDVVVGDAVNANAAWYYPDPKPKAASIKDRVAFWHGVTVS